MIGTGSSSGGARERHPELVTAAAISGQIPARWATMWTRGWSRLLSERMGAWWCAENAAGGSGFIGERWSCGSRTGWSTGRRFPEAQVTGEVTGMLSRSWNSSSTSWRSRRGSETVGDLRCPSADRRTSWMVTMATGRARANDRVWQFPGTVVVLWEIGEVMERLQSSGTGVDCGVCACEPGRGHADHGTLE